MPQEGAFSRSFRGGRGVWLDHLKDIGLAGTQLVRYFVSVPGKLDKSLSSCIRKDSDGGALIASAGGEGSFGGGVVTPGLGEFAQALSRHASSSIAFTLSSE